MPLDECNKPLTQQEIDTLVEDALFSTFQDIYSQFGNGKYIPGTDLKIGTQLQQRIDILKNTGARVKGNGTGLYQREESYNRREIAHHLDNIEIFLSRNFSLREIGEGLRERRADCCEVLGIQNTSSWEKIEDILYERLKEKSPEYVFDEETGRVIGRVHQITKKAA